MAIYKKLDSKYNKAPLLAAVLMGFSFSSSSEDNVASAILLTPGADSVNTQSTGYPNVIPRAFPFS